MIYQKKGNIFGDDPKFPQNLNLLGPLFRTPMRSDKNKQVKWNSTETEIFRDNLKIETRILGVLTKTIHGGGPKVVSVRVSQEIR